MIDIIATAAVSALASSAIFHMLYSNKMRRLNNGIAIRDRKLAECARDFTTQRAWLHGKEETIRELETELRLADERATKAEVALKAEKAKDSARTAKGNRTRRLNRLARELGIVVPQGAGGSNVASTVR